MNGQMYQMCGIAAAAKKALQEQTTLLFTPAKYVNRIEFHLLPQEELPNAAPHIAASVADWYDSCRERGLQDIKMMMPTTVEDRSSLGFSNTTKSSLVCFFNERVTYFTAHWDFDAETKAWNILHTEYEWKDAPPGRPRYNDESASFLEVLINIKALAHKINCGEFAGVFQSAIDILEGNAGDGNPEYELSLPALPKKHLRIFIAAGTADVFGAMGSWNDSPPGMAAEKDLHNEYEELSDALLKQMRLAILYAINEW